MFNEFCALHQGTHGGMKMLSLKYHNYISCGLYDFASQTVLNIFVWHATILKVYISYGAPFVH